MDIYFIFQFATGSKSIGETRHDVFLDSESLFSVYLYFRHFSVKILLTAFILPLIAGLWSYRNYQKTGYFHFSSIKMQNLLELNAGAVISYKSDHETMKSHRKLIRSESDKMNTYKKKSEFLLRTAEDTI